VQENLLEDVACVCVDPFLLVGGKALEWYGLRKGRDTDWIVSAETFQALRVVFPEGYFTNAFGDEGVRLGQHEWYCSLFGLRYELLIVEARQSHHYLVASPEVLWCLKVAVVLYDTHDQKAWEDIFLLRMYLDKEE
jgi:hypothetical protein